MQGENDLLFELDNVIMEQEEYQGALTLLLQSNFELKYYDDPVCLKNIFSNIDDEFWFWILTEGNQIDPRIQKILPLMPEEEIQLNFTGRCGKDALTEAFSAYKFFKKLAKEHGKEIAKQETILDFGCGWGRIIRFFLKDLNPTQIFGTDCFREMIDICNNSNMHCNFDANDPMPPLKYSDNMFDIIYLYSVFSHLSEEAHLAWLKEFHRILKPGGIFIATTRPIEFIEYCHFLAQKKKVSKWERGSKLAFPDPNQAIIDFKKGNYIFSPTGGGGILDKSFFGECCIPEQYVKEKWKKFFKEIEYIPASFHHQFDQTVIVGIK